MRAIGVGIGLAIGAGLVYGFYSNEGVRLVVVGLGAFVLAVVVIGGTALVVNRQWMGLVGPDWGRTTHHHRYQLSLPGTGRAGWGAAEAGWGSELPPVMIEAPAREEEEVVA